VCIGDRQYNREHGENVIFADYKEESIFGAIKTQLAHGRYPSSDIFGSGNAGKLIAEKIPALKPNLLKPIMY